MQRPHPRLDLPIIKLLLEKQIPELGEPLAENLEASGGQDPMIVELIGRHATAAIFPRVLRPYVVVVEMGFGAWNPLVVNSMPLLNAT